MLNIVYLTNDPMTDTSAASALVIPQLIVGLGNPEPKYDHTRHNIGFAAIDVLAQTWQISLTENRKFQALYGEGTGPRGKARLLKPLTYMNRSGQAIRATMDWYKLAPTSVLVIYDDMDLPLGRIRLRCSGSAGGHNGMKSTIMHLGTDVFPRLRIGIGKPVENNVIGESSTISYVLGRFTADESKRVTTLLNDLVLNAVEISLKFGVERAMNLYNNQVL
jgi:peptidyl-tRNA hydrolase, PTH1 family